MTKHFKKEEFRCRCGCGYDDVSLLLVQKLEMARVACNCKFIITSGCRCETHNEKVGGVKNSAHIKGYAADIKLNDEDRVAILQALTKEFDRIGIAKEFVHVDVDPTLPIAQWKY